MATKPLTKPQIAMLTKVMRADGIVSPNSRSATRVLGNLMAAGLVDGGFNEGFLSNVSGLQALSSYRRSVYGKRGSMASILDMEEVEAALSAQVSK